MSRIYRDATELVFDDVFLELPGVLAESRVILKIEGLNPAGSIKFKTALGLVDSVERDGRLRPGGRVVESSSGSLGVALSQVCAQRGYRFTCVVDPVTNPQAIAHMRAMGAEVLTVRDRDENGGFLATRIRLIERLLHEDPELVWVNQYANPANPAVHARLTARSILEAVPHVHYLFVGVGTAGTMMGCVAAFRRSSPATRIIAADSVGSVTFGQAPGPRHIPGLGTSRHPEICDPTAPDDLVRIREIDTIRECRDLSRRTGLLVGGSTGTVVRAIRSYADRIPPGSTVVAISPDFGDRYLTTIYDSDWVERTYGLSPTEPLSPSETVMRS
ncbi:2,3-diaminopropionate biosynthesis protein SbnA [Amycolatopsis mediterranei]|uniref:2,3-diaminopropionate biosynthesis protein SbnA n=1 Tax=Amycolatopsis mediterranei TaxID=33910 RepID=UPI00342ECBEF